MISNHKKRTELELEIISLLKKADKKAISLLCKNYSESLYGIICRTIPSEEVATEVLQDVFLKVWKNADKYNPDKGRLFTWLTQITRNTCIDRIRSGKYQRGTKTTELNTNIYNSETHSETIDVRDSGLQAVINKMDPKHYKLIKLIYFQGYTQSEAAKELEIPLGTVKSRLRTALLDLRKTLGGEMMLFLVFLFLIINILSKNL